MSFDDEPDVNITDDYVFVQEGGAVTRSQTKAVQSHVSPQQKGIPQRGLSVEAWALPSRRPRSSNLDPRGRFPQPSVGQVSQKTSEIFALAPRLSDDVDRWVRESNVTVGTRQPPRAMTVG